jgi:serine/threonine protein kinase
MLAPGTILQNRYHVIRQLGQGGMGTVYEAKALRLNTTVALKETHFSDVRFMKQFEREAQLLAALRHPALPRVIDHFDENNGLYLVMDFVEGEDLWETLRKRGNAFPVDEVLGWADQLLDALQYLHSQDPPVIHRDIKLQNLKVTGNDRITLLDFGLAKGLAVTNVITTRTVLGYSLPYAPLEQVLQIDESWVEHLSVTHPDDVERLRRKGTDHRSDLYSVGATLLHLLTNKTPSGSPTRAISVWSGRHDPLTIVLKQSVHEAVGAVLARSMELEPEQRFASAAEMRYALRGVRQQQAPTMSGPGETTLPITVRTPPEDVSEETIIDLPPTSQKPLSSGRGQWDENSFFEEARKHLKQNELQSLRRLYDYTVKSARVNWGTGAKKGTFNAVFGHINSKSLYSVATNGDLYLNFAWVVDTQAGAEAAKRLGPRLRYLRGFNIPSNYSEKYITVPLARWVNQVDDFIRIVDDIVLPEGGRQGDIKGEDEETVVASPMLGAGETPKDESLPVPARHATYYSPDAVKQLQEKYWKEFGQFLKDNSTFLNIPTSQPQRYVTFGIGRSNFRLAASIRVRERWIQVDLTLSGPHAKQYFDMLERDRGDIEHEVGLKLDWHKRPKDKESWILVRQPCDPSDQLKWTEQHAWLMKTLESFHGAFEPRVKQLTVKTFDDLILEHPLEGLEIYNLIRSKKVVRRSTDLEGKSTLRAQLAERLAWAGLVKMSQIDAPTQDFDKVYTMPAQPNTQMVTQLEALCAHTINSFPETPSLTHHVENVNHATSLVPPDEEEAHFRNSTGRHVVFGTGRDDISGDVARIDEPVIAININQQYPQSKTAEELYHATRGIWRLSRARAERARYAFAIYQGVIKEVYTIHRWMPATKETTEYWDKRSASQGKYFPSEVNEGRSEFVGEIAPEAIRQKYVGRMLPKRHSQNPILYFNC